MIDNHHKNDELNFGYNQNMKTYSIVIKYHKYLKILNLVFGSYILIFGSAKRCIFKLANQYIFHKNNQIQAEIVISELNYYNINYGLLE